MKGYIMLNDFIELAKKEKNTWIGIALWLFAVTIFILGLVMLVSFGGPRPDPLSLWWVIKWTIKIDVFTLFVLGLFRLGTFFEERK